MVRQLIATKRHMTQAWTKSGVRIPVTVLFADDCMVVGKGNAEGNIQIGGAVKKLKNVNKPQRAQLEKANIKTGFRKVIETTVTEGEHAAGSIIAPADIFSLGDIVKVTGTSKGTGFTGVVKRHGFAGGPRTHGQSDRERAPGSIGAGTTPGRVYKQKRMAGRAGNERVTVEGLQIVAIDGTTLWVKGLVPGAMNSPVIVTKVESKEFEGLLDQQINTNGSESKTDVEVAPEAQVETPVEPVAQEKKE